MKKRLLAIICTLGLTLSVLCAPAYGVNNSSSISTNIPSSFPTVKRDPNYTVINFWTATTGTSEVTIDQLVNWFNATKGKQNKVYVKNVFQGAYIGVKLQSIFQSHKLTNLPDLALFPVQNAYGLRKSKSIFYLDDLIAADKTFSDNNKFNSNIVNACSYKGKMLGLPFAPFTNVLYYNVDTFKSVGLDADNPPKTFDELTNAVLKLIIKGKGTKPLRYGLVYKFDATNLATWITRMKGGKGTSFCFDHEDGRIDTPTKLICAQDGSLKSTLISWKKVTDTGGVDYNASSIVTAFETGSAAMMFSSMTNYQSVESYIKNSTKPFEHRMTRLPSISSNDGIASHIGCSAVLMFNRGNKVAKDAAWEFIKFLASSDVDAFWASKTGCYSLYNDTSNTLYMQDFLEKNPNLKTIYKIREDSAMNIKAQLPMIPNTSIYSDAVAEQTALFVQGKTTVDLAVSTIAKKVNAMFSD